MVVVRLCNYDGCPCPWWMSATMLHVHVHVVCLCQSCMSMSMYILQCHVHVQTACPCRLSVCVCVGVGGHVCVRACVCVCVYSCLCARVLMLMYNAGMPDCPASDQSGTRIKKLVMPGLGCNGLSLCSLSFFWSGTGLKLWILEC
jgi:hypothetical protein